MSDSRLRLLTLSRTKLNARAIALRRRAFFGSLRQWKRPLWGWESLEARRLLATLTWNTSGSGDWGTASNWIPAQVPTSSDDVIIPSLTGSQSITVSSGSRAARTIQVGGDEKLKISGGTLTVSAATSVISGTGSVEVSGGTLSLAGNGWSNNSTLVLSTGTLNLGGVFSQAALGSLQRTGGTVNVTGTIDGNATLDATTGSWRMNGSGGIRNGALTIDPSVSLTVTNGTLNNVSIPNGTDVIVAGNGLNITNGLLLNGRILLGNSDSFGNLGSSVNQTISGTGEILFNSKANAIQSNAGSLIIGSGITISGQNLVITGTGSITHRGEMIVTGTTSPLVIQTSNFTNEGTIRSESAALTINSSQFTNAAGSQIITTGGTLSMNGASTSMVWSNLGLIQVTGTTVSLGGTFTQANLGNFQRDAAQPGIVSLTGILDGNLALGSNTGSWRMSGSGRVRNGTLTIDPSVSLTVTSGTLDNATVPSGTDVNVAGNGLNITNGLVLNGRILLGTSDSFGNLGSSLNQTISGTGQILFNTKVNGIQSNAGTLIIGTGITLSGQNLAFSGTGSITHRGEMTVTGTTSPLVIQTSTFTNEGTIRSQSAALTINSSQFTNTVGAQIITNGGTLSMNGVSTSMVWANHGLIHVTGTTVSLGGTFTQANLGNFQRDAAQPGTVSLTGILDGNLTLGSSTGSWRMSGSGRVRNGTLTIDPSVSLTVTSGTLDNATVPSGTDVNVAGNSLNITNGLLLNGRILLGTTDSFGELRSAVSQTISGTGQIQFNAKVNGLHSSAGTLIIGSGITLSGQSLAIGGTSSITHRGELIVSGVTSPLVIQTSNFTNEGTIRSESAALTINSSQFTNAAGAQIITTGGTLSMNGTSTSMNWANQGLIQVSGTTVTLGGSFTQANLGNFQRDIAQPGTVSLTGNLEGNLTLDSNTGAWRMSSSGRVRNGTITIDPSVSLTVTIGTFDNVMVASGTEVVVTGNALNLSNGLVLNGRIQLGNSDSSGYLRSSASQTISGTGEISFNHKLNKLECSAGTLTIGSGVLLTGQVLTLSGNGAITLEGELIATGPATSAPLVSVETVSFTNVGTLHTRDGGVLNLRANSFTNLTDVQSVGTNLLSATVQGGHFVVDDATLRFFNSTNSNIRYQLKKLESAWTISGTNATIYDGGSSTANPLLSLREIGTAGDITLTDNAVLSPTGEVVVRGDLTVEATSIFGNSTSTSVRQVGGTVTVNGIVQSTTPYRLESGLLKGSGTLPTSLDQDGGTLAPGNSPGCLTVNGNYDLASGASLQIEIAGGAACTHYDRLTVNGTVTVDGTLDVQLDPTYLPTIGTKFLVLANDLNDAVTGKFRYRGTVLRERQVFEVPFQDPDDLGGRLMRISYIAGDGNDVELEYLGQGRLVTNTNASGAGSFEKALDDANGDDGDTRLVAFAIDDALRQSNGYLIQANFGLGVNSNVIVDATTQYDYVGTPVVEWRGINSPPNPGIAINGQNGQVRGLSLTSWPTAISVSGFETKVESNYIGIPLDGTNPLANGTGISVITAGSANIQNNVISGSSFEGISLSSLNNSVVQGNVIGTDPAGTNAVPNQVGVRVDNSSLNLIEDNLISGNLQAGIAVIQSDSTQIVANRLGVDTGGASALANGIGIALTDAEFTFIRGNLISGNTTHGISLSGGTLHSNIEGNFIGLESGGQGAVPNLKHGIFIEQNSDFNTIGGADESTRNVISGNGENGITVNASNGNLFLGNYIGLDFEGSFAVPNLAHGVSIENNSQTNIIGGPDDTARNIISGNGSYGVSVVSSNDNRILGNYVGLDRSGELEVSNSQVGIGLNNANFTSIGSSDGAIKGNRIVGASAAQNGIAVENQSDSNTLVGNYLGLSATNLPLGYLGNAITIQASDGNTVGGDTEAERNVVVQYSSHGIVVGNGSELNVISGNYVGVHPDGQTEVFTEQHVNYGIAILNSSHNSIGLPATGSQNLIGGNQYGVYVAGAASSDNHINGNWIGLTADGTAKIPNYVGILVADASNTSIGVDGHNIVSGNRIGIEIATAATRDTVIAENWLGSNGAGSTDIGVALGNTESAIRHVAGVRTLIRENIIVANGPYGPLQPNPPGTVEVLGGDAVISKNLIFNNFHKSIRTDAFPGTITITQSRLDGFAIGSISGATPFTTMTVEFFEADEQGQANRYVGTDFVVTDENGNAEFEIGSLGDLTPGKILTATITGAVTEGAADFNTSSIGSGAIPQVALIRGLPTRSPEGTPIHLQAFAVDSSLTGYAITGYVWEVINDGLIYATGNEAAIQFAPDDEGVYTIRLKLTLTNTVGDQQTVVLGPHDINVFNVAPTPQFEIDPYQAALGQNVNLRSSSTDPGREDLVQHRWEVRYGSPNGSVVFSIGPATSLTTASFTPTAGGNYYMTLTVDDNDGGASGSRSLTRLLQVKGTPASTSIIVPSGGSEGQTIRARVPEAELQRAEELSFAWQVLKNGVAYPFSSPSTGVIEFIPDDDGTYKVSLVVSDGTNSVSATTKDVLITNASPVVSVQGLIGIAESGQLIDLTASIFDPGTADSHNVHWTVERQGTIVATGDSNTSPWAFSFTPSQGGIYKIVATATDDDFNSVSGVGRATGQKVIYVADSSQGLVVIPPANPDGGFIEGASYDFTSSIPNLPAGVTVSSYQWSALDSRGRTLQPVSGTGPNVVPFSFAPPSGGEFIAVLEVLFSNGRSERAVSLPITVQGLAPLISAIDITSHATNQRVNEGDLVVVRATALDLGERLGLKYRWELQRPDGGWIEVAGLAARPSEMQFSPQNQGIHRVRVTVSDSEGLSVTKELSGLSGVGVEVLNALPVVQLSAQSNTNSDVTFQALAQDAGLLDQPGLTYSWSVNGGAFSTPTTTATTFTTALAGLNELTVRVQDDSGATDVRSYILLGSAANDSYTITSGDEAAAVAAGAKQLIYLALDGDDTIAVVSGIALPVFIAGGQGNDTLDASTATGPVILEGGDNDDTLKGGLGNDRLVAGSGTNILQGGNGHNTFVGGGSDTMVGGTGNDYYFVHFSNVAIEDTSGGMNTVDLSLASQGVTLDFGSTTGVAQSVFPGSTLSLNGDFQSLIGSSHNDTLATSRSGTSLRGGGGNDRLVASANNVTLDGGNGNSELVLANASGSFIGGNGASSITGTLSADSSSMIELREGGGAVHVVGAPTVGTEKLAELRVLGGGGNSSISVERVRGKIYAFQGIASGEINEFGSASAVATRMITISNSTEIDIYGSGLAGNTVSASHSQDVRIFGTGGDIAELNQVTRATIDGSLFGTAAVAAAFTANISASTDIDIFGSARAQLALVAAINNSTEIDIFGSARSRSQLMVQGGQDIDIFGVSEGSIVFDADSAAISPRRASIHISDFGSTETRNLPITINAAQDIDIFGTAALTGTALNATIHASTEVDIFGSAARQTALVVTGSSDIDIYGVLDGDIRLGPADSSSTTDAVSRVIIEASGLGSTAAAGQLNLTINNSSEIDIFGGITTNSARLNAAVFNSTEVDIFGSARGGALQVTASQDIDIYGQGSETVTLNDVDRAAIFTQIFGSAVALGALQVNIANQSTDIDIFGSGNRNARLFVSDSSDIDIFGGTAQTEVLGVTTIGDVVELNHVNRARVVAGVFGAAAPLQTVMNLSVSNNSTDVDIFGSARGRSVISVSQSQDIDIFSGFGDTVSLDSVQRASIDGGVFGTAAPGLRGLSTTIVGSSQDIDIYGTGIDDSVSIDGGSNYRLAMRAGNDEMSIANAHNVVAVFDQGDDSVVVNSGTDMLLYLASGNDRAAIHGGQNIRVIGGDGDDQFLVTGGSQIDIDGGAGNDLAVIVNGSSTIIRLDGGENELRFFGGAGALAMGGSGNDRLSVYGKVGSTLLQGQVHALLDGGDGDDELSIHPLYALDDPLRDPTIDPLANLPSWIQLPSYISAPTSTTYASSLALVGGKGKDKLTLKGNQRLFAFGGDDDDRIYLKGGSTSTISGGDGADILEITSLGIANYLFGGTGDDQVAIYRGSKVAAFTEDGNDAIAFEAIVDALSGASEYSSQSFARGGLGDDHFTMNAGKHILLAGEMGQNEIEIRGGHDIVAAGGNGHDRLKAFAGEGVLLLGENGHDQLEYHAGVNVILSGGDGDDRLSAFDGNVQLYGDDGDDWYAIGGFASENGVRIRELIYLDGQNFEAEARGIDTIDLSNAKTTSSVGATLDLRTLDEFQIVIPGSLKLHLLGALENVIGTSANDWLYGNDESNRLQGAAGNDSLFGFGGDDLLEGGDGDNTLVGHLGNDQYLIHDPTTANPSSHRIIEAAHEGIDRLDFSQLSVGLGALSLATDQLQSIAAGKIRLTLLNEANDPNSSVAAIEELTGTKFDDVVSGNSLDNRFEFLGGNDSVDGAGGNDLYVFAGIQLGSLILYDSAINSGRRTLDFTAFTAPLDVDLALNSQQNLGGQLALTLVNPLAFHNVVGTSFDDRILGNANTNAIFGAAGQDHLEGRDGADQITADLPQYVLLDFDSAFRAERGDYDYTANQRAQILTLVADRFAEFNWKFTLSEAEVIQWTKESGRSYIRMNFSEGRGGGVSGDAGEIDFRNINRGLVSQVNLNSLKASLPAILAEVLGREPTAAEIDEAMVDLSAHIAAHELGHTAGLRHADALGPIGSGFYINADLSKIYPAYTGPLNAHETRYHLIASPASLGTTIADALGNTFWGARESIKLAFNEQGRTVLEANTSFGGHGNLNDSAQNLGELSPLFVPNLAPIAGFTYSNAVFEVSAIAVVGSLSWNETAGATTTERDIYRFNGRSGEWVNIELLANGIRPIRGQGFDGQVKLYNSLGQLIAWNDDEFEGTKDAVLFDVQLPADGEYYIEVSLSDAPAIDGFGDRYELFVSRFKALPANSPAPAVLGDTVIGGLGSDEIYGSAADDLFLATQAGGVDTIFGRGGLDTLDILGLDYQYNPTQLISLERIVNENIAPTATLIGVPITPVVASTPWTVSLIDPVDPSPSDTAAGFRYAFAMKRQDGTIANGSLVTHWNDADADNSRTFNVPEAGSYTLVARILDVRNGYRDVEGSVAIEAPANHAPTDIVLDNPKVEENRSAGTVVGTLSAVDKDEGETFVFELVNGDGDSDNALFEVVGNILRTKQLFDREIRGNYSIRVQVRDSADNAFEKSLAIAVGNAPEMVGAIVVGDGSVQRSLIKQLSFVFDTEVLINEGAFVVQRRDFNAAGILTPVSVPIQVSQIAEANGNYRVIIKFVYSAGSTTVRQGSLALQDGNYQLLIDGSKVLSVSDGISFDADRNGESGGTTVFGNQQAHGFYSFFGDVRGLRVVGAFENNEFRKTINKLAGTPGFDDRFDVDGNGAIGAFDNNEIRKSLLKQRLNWR
jgi:Ca2+-binding RTX toxin-like protein